MLLRLHEGEAHKKEYMRSIGMALVTWIGWYNTLPGCYFSEEFGEASLSVLGRRIASHPQFTTVEQVKDLFLTMPSPTSSVPGCQHPGADTVLAVSSNVDVLVNATSLVVRYVPWRGGGAQSRVLTAYENWPGQLRYPSSLWVAPDRDDLRNTLVYVVNTVLHATPGTDTAKVLESDLGLVAEGDASANVSSVRSVIASIAAVARDLRVSASVVHV